MKENQDRLKTWLRMMIRDIEKVSYSKFSFDKIFLKTSTSILYAQALGESARTFYKTTKFNNCKRNPNDPP